MKRADFLRVYENGRRIEGRLMTVFILPAKGQDHRVGITATKKAIGNAVMRNRAKRLLRESFRSCRLELDAMNARFDWVLNARRGLIYAKLDRPLAELREIITRISNYGDD